MDIRDRLREKGLTQQDIARRLDVSTGTVSKWLNRYVPMPMRVVPELAAMLGMKVQDIVKSYAETRK